MESLSEYLWRKKKEKGYLFVPYHAPGDPSWEASLDIIDALVNSGADAIELGLPFTDPAADGPVLQRAFSRILENGYDWEQFFKFMSRVHAKYPEMQFITMGYANLFFQAGLYEIFKKLYKVGVTGVIIPDVPIEEKVHLLEDDQRLAAHDMAWIDLVTPTITKPRMEKICQRATGFVYLVSYKGVTGGATFNLNPLRPIIKKVKSMTKIPTLVGFGVREKAHAEQCVKWADGFIIASRLHEIIEHNLKNTGKIPGYIEKEIKKLLPT